MALSLSECNHLAVRSTSRTESMTCSRKAFLNQIFKGHSHRRCLRLSTAVDDWRQRSTDVVSCRQLWTDVDRCGHLWTAVDSCSRPQIKHIKLAVTVLTAAVISCRRPTTSSKSSNARFLTLSETCDSLAHMFTSARDCRSLSNIAWSWWIFIISLKWRTN